MANYPNYNPYLAQQWYGQTPVQPGIQQAQMPVQPAPVQQAPVQQSVPAYAMRAVSDVSEMYGMQVDFNGTPIFGWDMAHGVIYRRQFNLNTGKADLAVYRLENAKPEQQEYVTVSQFNRFVNDVNERLKAYDEPAEPVNEHNPSGANGSRNARRGKPDADRQPDGAV